MEVIREFLGDFEALLMDIATSMVVLGGLAIAILYLGSALPIIGNFRREHPRVVNEFTIGYIILALIAGGFITGIVAS